MCETFISDQNEIPIPMNHKDTYMALSENMVNSMFNPLRYPDFFPSIFSYLYNLYSPF